MQETIRYFSFFMIAVYLMIGLLLIFTSLLMNIITEYRFLLGVVFIIYAGIRTFMTIRRYK